MLKYNKEEGNGKMLSSSKKRLVTNLKGQASKILSAKAAILREEEKGGLEGICGAIDALILSNYDNEDFKTFNDEITLALKFLKKTRKEAIKKRILPIVKDIVKDEWSNE